MILNAITEFFSLESFVRASASVWRCVGTHGIKLVEKILETDTPLRETTRDIIRMIPNIREGVLPMQNLGTFQHRTRCTIVPQARVDGDQKVLDYTHISAVSPEVVRSILMTASSIFLGTLDCLDYHLGRLKSLRPHCPALEDFEVRRQSYLVLQHEFPDPVEIEPMPKADEPIGWAEEHIVVQALWRCQLVFDLKRAIRKGIVRWPAADVETLMNSTVSMVYGMQNIHRWVQLYMSMFKPPAPEWQQMELVEHGAILTVLEYLHIRPLGSEALTLLSGRKGSPPEVPEPQKKEMHWSWGVILFHRVFKDLTKAVDFDFFRSHGFGIWSRDRLENHGFGHSSDIGRDLLAWTSVLPQSQIDYLEAWEEQHNSSRGIPASEYTQTG